MAALGRTQATPTSDGGRPSTYAARPSVAARVEVSSADQSRCASATPGRRPMFCTVEVVASVVAPLAEAEGRFGAAGGRASRLSSVDVVWVGGGLALASVYDVTGRAEVWCPIGAAKALASRAEDT